ncbi:MAG: hypothetical protein WBA93_32540 [Microcoleaceae cyanobacterium]
MTNLAKQNNFLPEKKPTLVELAEEFKDSIDIYEFASCTCDSETIDKCEQELKESISKLGDKLEACYFAAKMLDKEGDALLGEANDMRTKAASKKKAASAIIGMVKEVAMSLGGYKGERFKFTVCNNSTAPVWKQQDVSPNNIPDEFILTETVHHIDWKTIEKLAKESKDGCVYGNNGEVIAKVLPRGKHVRIR